MKIAIFGTSNSLLNHGWVRGVYDGLAGIEICNFSVGNSPGSQFATLLGIDFNQFDFFFLILL
jgi:hypothetical protein